MNWDLTQVLCDGFCGPRYEHHLMRIGIGAGVGLLIYLVSGKADWRTVLLTTGVIAGIHAITAIPKYGFDRGDHLADAAYTTIGAAVVPIAKSDHKLAGYTISAGIYVIAYPHSSP